MVACVRVTRSKRAVDRPKVEGLGALADDEEEGSSFWERCWALADRIWVVAADRLDLLPTARFFLRRGWASPLSSELELSLSTPMAVSRLGFELSRLRSSWRDCKTCVGSSSAKRRASAETPVSFLEVKNRL